jgi:hypothetical protein
MADTPDDLATLRKQFHALMVETLHRCKTEIKYNPSYVVAHMAEHDGVDTAIWLVSIPTYSSGFERLWREGRLDLSAEALVLRAEYAPLFSVELRRRAWDTLQTYQWDRLSGMARP